MNSLSDRFGLAERVCVVTGGGSGLGEAICLGFADAGATVIVIDIDMDAAERVCEAIRQRGGTAAEMKLDVTHSAEVEEAAKRTIVDHGRVDVLVNSAGTAARHPAEDFPEDAWDRVIRINLKGSFLPCQSFGRLMLEARRGSIINLASIGGSIAYPHTTAYLQSKGGVVQLTRSLALEWADRGVRVNALAPGLFNTPLVRRSDQASNITSTWIDARTPLGRRGEPDEIVGPAIFLASDASSMVTGHILQVDGGYLVA